MTDRRNRIVLGTVGLVLLAAAVLTICLGAQVFGVARSDRFVFDPTVVRWWNEGGWESFAVVVVIGLVAAVIGSGLVRSQLRRNDGLRRTPAITFASTSTTRGATVLRAAGLSHVIETDLTSLPDVVGARVGLFGPYPDVGMRAVVDVGDDIDLGAFPDRLDEVLQRVERTTGLRPSPLQITLAFRAVGAQRRIA